jgi:hypothetical protein
VCLKEVHELVLNKVNVLNLFNIYKHYRSCTALLRVSHRPKANGYSFILFCMKFR